MDVDPIARDPELAAIESFLDDPASGLRTLVLEGDVGIGKSTLWLAGVAAARERGYVVLQSRPAESEQAMAHVALGDLFRSVKPADLASLSGPQRAAFESAVLIEGGSGGPAEPRALGVAILSLLPRLAAGRPLVIAIDDCQWLDGSSTATLGFVLRRIEDTPIRLLLSRRPTPTGPTPIEDAAALADIERVQVGPMSVGGIQLLLGDRLAYQPSRNQLIRIHEASGGNPFYALELARAQSPDVGAAPDAPLVVPPSLERLVRARLTALEPVTRHALLLLAAHGRFPASSLPSLDLPANALDPAWTARIIEDDGGVIRFSHPMLPSLLYQDATDGDRRAAHRRLAAVVTDPVAQAHHVAIGADGPDAGVSATLELAAAAALHRGLPLAAADLAAHAVRLTPGADAEARFRRALLGGQAGVSSGDLARARRIAIDLELVASNGIERAEALVLRADTEPPSNSVPLLERALGEDIGPELAAGIHRRLVIEGRFVRSPAWAEAHARAFAELAEALDDQALRATALVTLALLEFDRGAATAMARARDARELAVASQQIDPLIEATLAIAHILTWSRTPGPARAYLEHELAIWGDRGEGAPSLLVWYLAMVEVVEGRWAEAIEHDRASRLLDVDDEDRPGNHLIPALVALHLGDLDTARARATTATDRPESEFREDFLAILATTELRNGRAAEAVATFEFAERTADERGQSDPSLRYWRAELADALVQVGRDEDARRLLDRWEADAVRLDRVDAIADARRARGALAAATGDLQAAIELLERAAEMHRTAGIPLGHGRALLALGEVRLRLRARRAARDDLERALAVFEGLGAAGWSATARAALARIGGRQRHHGLSPSERRVAELAAEGRTNQEIAAALFLSVRTVAGHLTNAYAKLGLRSRSELTRWLLSDEQSP
jgi:DNA-binding CsgD family transcriptional regulator